MTALDARRGGDHEDSAPAEERPKHAGWFEDPTGEHAMRYYDGAAWTRHVTHFGPTPCLGCK